MVTDKVFTSEEFVTELRRFAEALFAAVNEGHNTANVKVSQRGPDVAELHIEQTNRVDTYIFTHLETGQIETTRVFYQRLLNVHA